MKTFQELVDWIKTNIPQNQWGAETAERAALWWASNWEAEGCSDYTTDDIAQMLFGGVPATTPGHVEEILKIIQIDNGEDIEEHLRYWFRQDNEHCPKMGEA